MSKRKREKYGLIKRYTVSGLSNHYSEPFMLLEAFERGFFVLRSFWSSKSNNLYLLPVVRLRLFMLECLLRCVFTFTSPWNVLSGLLL